MKLNVRAFALTCGLVWGVGLFLITWWVILFDGASSESTVLGLVYRGYTLSPLGSLIGFAWAFVDGIVGGLVFAWLYNGLASRVGRQAPA